MTVSTFRTVFVAVLAGLFAASANSATYSTNVIEPFNQTLGTLQSVTLTVNPPAVTSSPYDASPFESIGSHNHAIPPINATLPFDTLNFPGGFSDFVPSQGVGSTHSHLVDRGPVTKVYTVGSNPTAFAWFNNPANAAINVIPLPAYSLFPNEDHGHSVAPQNVIPSVRFTYEVPEPAFGAALAGGIGLVLRRRSGR